MGHPCCDTKHREPYTRANPIGGTTQTTWGETAKHHHRFENWPSTLHISLAQRATKNWRRPPRSTSNTKGGAKRDTNDGNERRCHPIEGTLYRAPRAEIRGAHQRARVCHQLESRGTTIRRPTRSPRQGGITARSLYGPKAIKGIIIWRPHRGLQEAKPMWATHKGKNTKQGGPCWGNKNTNGALPGGEILFRTHPFGETLSKNKKRTRDNRDGGDKL